MADPIKYTGVAYDPSFFRDETEAMVDYMSRLIDSRQGGALGTSQGVSPVTQELTQAPLGEVVQNCPAGYVWNGTECVIAATAGGSGSGDSMDVSPGQARAQNNNFGFIDPSIAAAFGGLFGPFGGLIGRGLAELNNSSAISTAQDLAQIPEANRSSTFGQSLTSNIGNVTLGNKSYAVSLGGITGDQPSIVQSLFSLGTPAPTNPTLSLTPREVNLRRGMLNYGQNIADPVVTPESPNYIVDTGSGVTTSGVYNDSGDWSWSGSDFSDPGTTSDGNDWNSW